MRALFLVVFALAPALVAAQAPSLPSAPATTALPERDTLADMRDGGEVAMSSLTARRLVAEDSLWAEALRVHYAAIVLDGHVDTPTLMLEKGYDFGARHASHTAGAVDLPRMKQGGLDAAFFSLYVPHWYGEGDRASNHVDALIAEIRRQVERSPADAAIATSASEVRSITRSGRRAVLMGIEGGHALQADTAVLRHFAEEGVRYVTLTHVGSHSWADASQGPAIHNGLSPAGRELVRAMNRLGVLVDLSHVSDATFYDALDVTAAPVIVSHSSARAVTPGVRNIDDDMLRALADNGGVVMINFYQRMINGMITPEVMDEAERRIRARGKSLRSLWSAVAEVQRERGHRGATLEDVLDHIDHAIEIAGPDHVGLGSDFDGALMPRELRDVTRLPWLTYGLLKRGHSEATVTKILGGNALRILGEAERVAAR